MDTTDLLIDDELLVLDWRDLAGCIGHDPEIFFPAGETGPAAQQIRQAKRICGACQVQGDCLAHAVETNQVSGVWGGLTEDERRPVVAAGSPDVAAEPPDGHLRDGFLRRTSRRSCDAASRRRCSAF
jgi:WhiB family redox-sensing transcriptional regulator